MSHCLGLPYWHYQLVSSWYLHQPESHQLSLQNVCDGRTSGPKDRTPGLPGSDKNSIVELPKRLLLHQGLLSSGQCLCSYSSFNLVTLGPIAAPLFGLPDFTTAKTSLGSIRSFGYCKCFHRCYCTRNTMEAYNL